MRALTPVQARVFEQIQAEMVRNANTQWAGTAKWTNPWGGEKPALGFGDQHYWPERTIAALVAKELIRVEGDRIRYHPRRWLHGV